MDLMEKYLSRVKIKDREIELKDRKITANAEAQQIQSEEIEETTYTFDEVSKLIGEGVTTEGLATINKVKMAFSGTAESIESTKSNTNESAELKICIKCGKPGERFCCG